MLPPALTKLSENFKKFPGVGFRSSQKLALDVLSMKDEDFVELINSISSVKQLVKFCGNCGFFAEKELCEICSNSRRNDLQICLVEKATDVISLERSEIYKGKYHVLQSLISPLDNIFPENTTLPDLLQRKIPNLLQNLDQNPDTTGQAKQPKMTKIELILFFKAGFSAEATTAYLKEAIVQNGWQNMVEITRLAQGLPLYYNTDTLDQATMIRALEDRRGV